MDLSIFQSLKPCSLVEVKEGLEAAKSNVEFFVDDVEPKRFKELNFLNETSIYLTTTNSVLECEDDDFVTFFHQVLYESLQLDIDLKKFQKLKIWKNVMITIITVITLIFIFYPCSELAKATLFFIICALVWTLYRVYQYKVRIEVSSIQRKTNFKLCNDNKLETLPAVYIVDNKTMYIGSNFLGNKGTENFFMVESFEDQVALKTIYRDYARSSLGVTEEFLISHYLRIMGKTH